MERAALSFHEVLYLRTPVTLVKYGVHFLLTFTVDDERGKMRMDTARGVEVARVGVREKLAHMEHVMNLHVR